MRECERIRFPYYSHRRTEAWRAARERFQEARRSGTQCGYCGHDLPVDQPLHLAIFRHVGDSQGARAPVCEQWWAPVWPSRRRWSREHPCEVCGRGILFEVSGRLIRSFVCSPRCAQERHRRKYGSTPEPRECSECGEMFAPSRADAVTCGSPCRQRAYRNRTALRLTNFLPSRDLASVTTVPVVAA